MPSLSLYSDLSAAWRDAIEPWCRQATGHLCASGGESWLVCATRGQADWARDQLQAAGGGTLGLRFLTPFAFRARLASALGIAIDTTGREVLEFAVRSQAAVLGAVDVATDPAGWLDALNEADAAGVLAVPEFRARLVTDQLGPFVEKLRADPAWLPGVDRRIHASAQDTPRGAVRVGLLGLDERHAPLRPLFAAATVWARELDVWLAQPRVVGETATMAWIEALERLLGVEKEPLPHEPAGRQIRLVEQIENATHSSALEAPELLTGLRVSDEIELAAEFAARWLIDHPTGRCAFVFPAAGGGSVLLSRRLQAARLRHEDRLGERPEPSSNVRLLRALAAYHREGQSAPAFLRIFGEQRGQHDPAAYFQLERTLQRRFATVQIARAEVCARKTTMEQVIKDLGRFPEKGAVADFQECWDKGARAIGAGLDELQAFWDGIARWVPASRVVDGRAVLGALESALLAVPSQFARNPRNIPHSRLVLTSLREAAGQTWEGVVLMHSVESVWPVATPPARFLTESVRRHWNSRGGVRLREVHDAIESDEAAWLDLLAQCDGPVAFASRRRSAEVERGEQPNAWLVRSLAACAEPDPVRRWEGATQIREQAAGDASDHAELRAVHAARADSARPFDAHSFDYSELAPHPPSTFRPSGLDELLARPGQAALRHLFDAENRRDLDGSFARSFPQALGSLVHQWLANALNEAGQVKQELTRAGLAALLAEPVRSHGSWLAVRLTAELGRPAGSPLPRWWGTLQAEAEDLVRLFLEGLAESDFVDKGWVFSTEESIASNTLPRLSGRMDLAMRRGADAVVIDFKTGKTLAQPNAENGTGLELVGYAWCLAQQGSGELALGLAGRGSAVPVPKFTRDKLDAFERWRKRLEELQVTARYGWAGPLQAMQGRFEELPLTTVPVLVGVLRAKAALQGLEFARDEEPKWRKPSA